MLKIVGHLKEVVNEKKKFSKIFSWRVLGCWISGLTVYMTKKTIYILNFMTTSKPATIQAEWKQTNTSWKELNKRNIVVLKLLK